jgi:2-polyprenyl-3-methyl-5-hydroxy-6-metoxy-1,4-benzoquinol methylase
VAELEDAKVLHHRREEMRVLIAAHHAKFRDEDGTLKRSLSENRTCPVCDEDNSRELFKKNGGTYVACEECTMIYLNPVLKDDAIRNYYSLNTSVQAISHQLERDFYESIYREGLNLISSVIPGGRILDVGCSSGLFLNVAKGSGWSTFGTELNQTELEMARASGHVLWSGMIEEIPKDELFDVITLWDVFEHLKDGRGFLETARNRLTPNGALFLQIPNGGSFAARLLQDKCNVFDGVEHVCLYSVETIALLMEKCGWRIESMSSVIDELKPILNHLNFEHPYTGTFSFKQKFAFLDSGKILDGMLGYKLQIVARPK